MKFIMWFFIFYIIINLILIRSQINLKIFKNFCFNTNNFIIFIYFIYIHLFQSLASIYKSITPLITSNCLYLVFATKIILLFKI